MKLKLTLLIILTSNLTIHSQDTNSKEFDNRPTSIYDVVKMINSDSAIFYYNERWQLVRPTCASVYRISKIDTAIGSFVGKFIDYYTDSIAAVEGFYFNGKKEGNFKVYYPNGLLKEFGQYKDNKKVGKWEYFYPNGNKKQVFDFLKNEILILEFWDENGNKKVDSGTGFWDGYETEDKSLKISGGVLNGSKNGTWKKIESFRNQTIVIEKFKEGSLISGKFNSMISGVEHYKDTSYFSIDAPQAFITAEYFQINSCTNPSITKWEFAKYPGGMDKFYQEIRERILLNNSNFTRGIIKIQMTIDKTGKMTNFQPVTRNGMETELIRVLQTMGRWSPTKIDGVPTIQPKIISFEIR
jgi:hypothetical protein